MKKKAQLQFGLLFIIAILVPMALLISYSSSNSSSSAEMGKINNIVSEVAFNEKYVVSQARIIAKQASKECENCDAEELKQKYKEIAAETEALFRYEGAGNFYAKLRNDEFTIEEISGKKTIIITGLFVETESGYNKLRREFNLEILLDN